MIVLTGAKNEQKPKPTQKTHPFKATQLFHPAYSKPAEYLYSLDAIDTLSQVKDSIATAALIEKTSLNVVQCGIRVFRIMREIKAMIKPLSLADMERAAKILGITRYPDEGPNGIPTPSRGTILRRILELDPHQARRIALGQFQQPGHRPPDMPLHILIFYLREHLRAHTRRPHNEIVSGFLLEQDLADISPNRITKIGTSENPNRLRAAYDLFREIYEAGNPTPTSLEGLMSQYQGSVIVDSPSHIRDTMLFPSWEDYLPDFQK